MTRFGLLGLLAILLLRTPAPAADSHKNIVLISGDEEYRSEESLPQLAKILSQRQGFHCTVLFAIDPKDGSINPDRRDNIPGLEALDTADLMVILTRFRDLPDAQMKHIADYIQSGKPIVALRTATHAFELKTSPTYARYTWNNPDGGFGRLVLGETWINHHGEHGKQSTLGVIDPNAAQHPILRGIHAGDLWSPSDVYEVRLPLPGDSRVLVRGEVLAGMHPSDPAAPGPVNDPMMPVVWVKSYTGSEGRTSRVFVTTMGTSEDFLREGMRRLIVNACFWATGLEDRIESRLDVGLVGEYKPTHFGFGEYTKGVKPAALLP